MKRSVRARSFPLLLAWSVAVAGLVPGRLAAAPPYLVPRPSGLAVRGAGGELVGLPQRVAPGIERLQAVGSGWIAAGTAPRGDGRAIALVAARDGTLRTVAPPPALGARLQSEPVPLVAGDRWIGLAWLAGDAPNRLGVWAASRGERDTWSPPVRLAAPGPGSQVALTGTVLADGSWLLAWSAFDGHDDEILWSLRRHGTWSPPARLAADNAVPDITPSVVAAGDGALAAWSRYDGHDYRIVTARFDAAGWHETGTIGPRGALAPALSIVQGEAIGVFRAATRRWAIVHLDANGRLLGETGLARTSNLPPVPLAAGPDAVSFALPASGREETLRWSRRP